MKTTAITIPSKIKDNIPKPTKAQIIEALVERARIEHKKEEEAKAIKRESIESKMVDNALKAYWKMPDIGEVSVDYYGNVEIKIKPESCKNAKLVEQREETDRCYFYDDSVRKQIKAKLATPNPLIGNENVAKQLDQLLASIMGAKPAIEAQEMEVLPPGE